jgi:dihydrofolate reductase
LRFELRAAAAAQRRTGSLVEIGAVTVHALVACAGRCERSSSTPWSRWTEFLRPALQRFLGYRDDAYLRDGLGQLLACDAMLMGRTTYESFAKIWPGHAHPWAGRLNAIQNYVFATTLDRADWNNSTIIRGDVATEEPQPRRRSRRA